MEDGKKYIAIVEPSASIMRWAFEEIAKGIFSTEQIFLMAQKRGYKRGKSNFWLLIRNPVYCGKIFIPKYKDEKSCFVHGQHEPLITEGLFYNVQDVLDGRSRNYRSKTETAEEFPLRGFITCPKCEKKLSGSKCKGRHKHYYYYHCDSECKFRVNSDVVNDLFLSHLKKYQPIPEVKKLYSALISESFKEQASDAFEKKRRITAQIADFEKRLGNARDLLLSLQIDPSDYKIMKEDYGKRIADLENEMTNISNDKHNIEVLLDQGIDNLIRLNKSYLDSSLVEARNLIGLIYPENFTIRGNEVQTARVNKIIESIYLINNELGLKKNGTRDDFFSLSRKVTSTGFKPVTF